MNPEHELTVLLALKDRAAFTGRWMSYANRIRLPFAVFVADGGSDGSAARVLADRTAFPHVHYQYVRYPPDRSYTDYWTKIADALSRIRTPFVALADNDDLFVAASLRDAVSFLQSYPDYATCGGQCAVFWVGGSRRRRDEPFLYGDKVEWKCSLDDRSLTDESARDRIRRHSLRLTHPAYYHVRRTGDLKRHAGILRDLNLSDPFLIERLLFFLAAIDGKTKQLETLYLARQWNAPGSSGSLYQATHGDWLGRMLAPTWSRDFGKFLDAASGALAARDGLTVDEARRSVVELYRMWLGPQMLGDILAEPTVTMSMSVVVATVRRLLERSPESLVRRIARTLYRRARWISVDAVHGTQLRTRRVPNADEALRPIQEFVTSGTQHARFPSSV